MLAVSQMMWCRDVHKILTLNFDRQRALVKFEEKCFKLSILPEEITVVSMGIISPDEWPSISGSK